MINLLIVLLHARPDLVAVTGVTRTPDPLIEPPRAGPSLKWF
jgi:hypothetical protein